MAEKIKGSEMLHDTELVRKAFDLSEDLLSRLGVVVERFERMSLEVEIGIYGVAVFSNFSREDWRVLLSSSFCDRAVKEMILRALSTINVSRRDGESVVGFTLTRFDPRRVVGIPEDDGLEAWRRQEVSYLVGKWGGGGGYVTEEDLRLFVKELERGI
jgi:hypothetical protein